MVLAKVEPGVIKALLLTHDDVVLGEMALSEVRSAIAAIVTGPIDYEPCEGVAADWVAIPLRQVYFYLDQVETACQQLIDPSVYAYRQEI